MAATGSNNRFSEGHSSRRWARSMLNQSPPASTSDAAPIATSLNRTSSPKSAAASGSLELAAAAEEGGPPGNRLVRSQSPITQQSSKALIRTLTPTKPAAARSSVRLRKTAAAPIKHVPASSSFSICANSVLLEIALFSSAAELEVLTRIDRRWRSTLLSHDEWVWKPLCRDLWGGRYLSAPELLPLAKHLQQEMEQAEPGSLDVPPLGSPVTRHPVSPTARYSGVAASPTSRHSAHHLHHPHHAVQPAPLPQNPLVPDHLDLTWRKAFWRSIFHSRRDSLTMKDLQSSLWEIRFLLDNSIAPQPLQFHPNSHVRTAGFPQMPYHIYEHGQELHVHVFPTQKVTRDPDTWCWKMGNHFVEISTIGPALPLPKNVSSVSPIPAFPEVAETRVEDEVASEATTETQDSVVAVADEASSEGESQSNSRAGSRRCVSDLPINSDGYVLCFSMERENVARPRPRPPVTGHGGANDDEDPPPDDALTATRPCPRGDSDSTSNGLGAGTAGDADLSKGSRISRDGMSDKNSSCPAGCHGHQQGDASMSSNAPSFPFLPSLGKLVDEEWMMWEQLNVLRDSHAEGYRRADGRAPRRDTSHKASYLLDQGHPRKPP